MIFELAHQMALLPVLALIAILAKDEIPSAGHVFLSAAFFVSWIADSITTYFGEGGSEYARIWVPAQIMLACVVLVRGGVKSPVFIYFGIGTIALTLYFYGRAGPHVMEFWLFYQACRLAGILALCVLIFKPPQKGFRRVVLN